MPDTLTAPPDDYDAWAAPHISTEPEPPEPEPEGPPPEGIIPLGYNHGVFYYYSRGARQVVPVSGAQHTKSTLISLASIPYYWQRTQFNAGRGIDWEAAADDLMTKCRAIGVFDPDKIRGRGAWEDRGRYVLHLGDRLLVDGKPMPLELPQSVHVYQAARSLGLRVCEPLATRDAHRLMQICKSLRWERPVSGTLLAGFIAVASVGGALAWRPSIWVIGGAGSGKSYINDNILRPALAGTALTVASSTTASGIRQALNGDALPVLFDEAERESLAAASRMAEVLELVRQSASDSQAEIYKGSANQTGAKRFRTKSCFAFSSINHAITEQADAGRINLLSLKSPPMGPDGKPRASAEDVEAFARLQTMVRDTITPEFASALVARAVRLLPVIRANSETFSRAIATHLGSKRLGDQLGTLLAGAYSLHSEREISPAEAADYVQREEWKALADEGNTERDENSLLAYLFTRRVRVTPGASAPLDITVGQMIEAAYGSHEDPRVNHDLAVYELKHIGIRIYEDGAAISNTHPRLRELLQGKPGATDWAAAFMRLPGAEALKKTVRFGGLPNSTKAVYLPKSALGVADVTGGHGEHE